MIFVTVGTWIKGFDRLLKTVDNLIENNLIREIVLAQVGNSSYRPEYMKTLKFCSPEEFNERINSSRIIITHAGVGSMIQAIKAGKPVIVMPRKKLLGEAGNDHQFNTARHFEKEGKVLAAYEAEQMPRKIHEADKFNPHGTRKPVQILTEIQKFIDNMEMQS